MLKKLQAPLLYLFVIIAVVIGAVVGRQFAGKWFASKPSAQEVEARLMEGFNKAANEFKQKLPMMLDQDTRLDKVSVGPGARIVYQHTLPNYTSQQIDANWLVTNLRPDVVSKVCTSADMKQSLQYGGVFVYSYFGSDAVEISQFSIDRNDCGFEKIGP